MKGTRGHTLKAESPFKPQVSWFLSPEVTPAHGFLNAPRASSRTAKQPPGPRLGGMQHDPCTPSKCPSSHISKVKKKKMVELILIFCFYLAQYRQNVPLPCKPYRNINGMFYVFPTETLRASAPRKFRARLPWGRPHASVATALNSTIPHSVLKYRNLFLGEKKSTACLNAHMQYTLFFTF